MLGSENNVGGIQQSIDVQFSDDLPQGGVGVIQRLSEQRAGSASAVQIPAWSGLRTGGCCSGNGFIRLKTLGDADGLKIHAENRGNADIGHTGVIEAVDLVEKPLELHIIEVFGEIKTFGSANSVFVLTVDLQKIEVIYAVAGPALNHFVGDMFVRPGRAATGPLDHVEDRIHS